MTVVGRVRFRGPGHSLDQKSNVTLKRANRGFNTAVGRAYLANRVGVDATVIEGLRHLGLSSICNALAAIKLAKHLGLGREDVVITVATDGSEMYGSERARQLATRFGGAAAQAVADAKWGHMVALQSPNIVTIPITEALKVPRRVDPNHDVVQTARAVGISFGD